MRIAVLGRGHVGGGLADRWETAGHQVTRLGRDGGNVSGADVVLIAVPGAAVGHALDVAHGIQGKTVIDATNRIGIEPPASFGSIAEYIASRTGGPTAKAFHTNFAALYDRVDAARKPPCNVWCGDDGAREAVERLSRDAGYEPVRAGPLANAGDQEALIRVIFSISREIGPFVYRIAAPEDL